MRGLVIILAALLLACGGGELEQLGGVRYALEHGDCDSASGEYLLVNAKVTGADDSVWLNTWELGRKLELKLSEIDSGSSIHTLLDGLCLDDSMHLELPADSFYPALGGTTPEALRNQEITVDLRLHARLDEIGYQINKQLFEKEAMRRYIDRYGWNATYDSSSGIYYEKLSMARSTQRDFTKAYMSYVIKTLSDRPVSYSKEGEPWLFDKNDPRMLKGLHVVGSLLNERERIRALIPSTMAFGPKGLGKVGPFQPIIVEMELVEIIE